jgi:hypothetical protein
MVKDKVIIVKKDSNDKSSAKPKIEDVCDGNQKKSLESTVKCKKYVPVLIERPRSVTYVVISDSENEDFEEKMKKKCELVIPKGSEEEINQRLKEIFGESPNIDTMSVCDTPIRDERKESTPKREITKESRYVENMDLSDISNDSVDTLSVTFSNGMEWAAIRASNTVDTDGLGTYEPDEQDIEKPSLKKVSETIVNEKDIIIDKKRKPKTIPLEPIGVPVDPRLYRKKFDKVNREVLNNKRQEKENESCPWIPMKYQKTEIITKPDGTTITTTRIWEYGKATKKNPGSKEE